jgi:hypothetical protein
MTLLLHSLAANYNQYLGSRNQSQFGDRGPGSIVVTTESRGPDGGYDSLAGAEVFEVWADVARRYKLDPAYTVITGYSMGAFGTFKLGEQFPDLFARGQPTVGISPDDKLVPSLRNIPILMWNATADELVPVPEYEATASALDSAGYRYELDVYTAEHLTLAINDQYAPAATFLGTARVNRNPTHVTYVVDPKLDYPKLGFVADHAYYVSGVKPRDAGANGGQATVDVFSHGFGVGDPKPSSTERGAGTLTGGTLAALAFTSQKKTWGPAPKIPTADQLDVTATNVGTVTIDAPRAHVSCDPKVNLKSDGPTKVVITGCARQKAAKRCVDRRKFSFKLHHAPKARVVKVVVYVNGKRKLVKRGKDIRRVTIRRLPKRRFVVRIVATQSSGSQLISTRTYKGCSKGKPRVRARHHK